MISTTAQQRRHFENLDAPALVEHQLARLNQLLKQILPDNKFYREKLSAELTAERLADPRGAVRSLDELAALPYTFKDELLSSSPSNFAANLTHPVDRYVHFHQT